MAIDSSIYRGMASQTPDIMGAVDKGLRMRDLMDQRKEKSVISDAFKKHTTVGPDGKVNVDRGLVMKDLYAASPEAAIRMNEQFQTQDARDAQLQANRVKSQMEKLQMSNQLLSSATDQNTWVMSRNKAIEMGLAKPNELPEVFDPKFRDYLAGATMTQLERMNLKLKERELATKGFADPLAQEMKYERLDKMKRERADADFKRTPEGRLQSLSAEQKQRLDNAKLGLTSVQGMAEALLGQGQNTFSVIGDNDFTQQRGLFEEALGRMQSGGAITADEAARFKAMAPTFRDSADMQRKKLVQLQNEMASRLGTLGFKPAELGVSLSDISNIKIKNSGTAGLEKANAGNQGQVFKTSDIEWAD